MSRHRLFLALAAALVAVASSADASDVDEFRVKREAVFEFVRKPRVTQVGDRITIAFETKGYCDVTIAIEEAVPEGVRNPRRVPDTLSDSLGSGRIIRHLASGVLGPNAPEPFQRDSKSQAVIWDGKDDHGRYIDNRAGLTVRVSLGLKPQFERTLFWSPHKRVSRNKRPLVCAQPEGVYVFEGEGADHIRFFDHRGNYLRTVYPFPADKLEQVKGLNWATFPQDGKRLPLKVGLVQASMLTSGENTQHYSTSKYQPAATCMAVGDGRIFLASLKLNRLGTDGTSGGLVLTGPRTSIPSSDPRLQRRVKAIDPRSAALSPDGKRLYLTGYYFQRTYPRPRGWLPCVMRLDPTKDEEPTVFAGSVNEADAGSDDAHFKVPTSVACDAEGRVYVADYMNDRIQVFLPDGSFYKTVRIKKPAEIAVHRRTGEIYVFSWNLVNRYSEPLDVETPMFTRLGPLDRPAVKATYVLPLEGHHNKVFMNKRAGLQHGATLDSWTDPPTIWLVPGTPGHFTKLAMVRGKLTTAAAKAHLRLLVEEDGKLVMKRDFGEDVLKAIGRAKPPVHARQRLYVNPVTGLLYVAEGQAGVSKSYKDLLEMDGATGRITTFRLPFDAEDLAFDLNGLIYLRTENVLVRFDPTKEMKEIPFDYGETRASVGFSASRDSRRAPAGSAIIMPSQKPGCFHQGGMWVSPRGNIVVSCYNRTRDVDRRAMREIREAYAGDRGREYRPTLYPGRQRWGEVHIWDPHGRLLHEDAFPGLPMIDGIAIDKDDNVYVMATPNRVLEGEPYFLERAETLIKLNPRRARIISAGTKGVPIPLDKAGLPKGSPDLFRGGQMWVENAEWMYGGVGFGGFNSSRGGGGCACWHARFALDLYARSFAPEVDHFSVAVLDTNGNLILRVGRYGNADSRGPDSLLPLGGDEVGLVDAAYVATHTDRRLFIADGGNARILSVTLGYHATERVPLKDASDIAK